MTAQFARGPFRGRFGGGSASEPHAALLIDFDNVTMGIRSDLTKELKNLLNSDIIKGKVAVQRAYADWRRYPQYIVPLAESSVDLIFAPAYGSAKKNATDIRLAIDAVELVFTRPEIGTIILLSGDSDFSSLVLKLKEYGKYVIGVGIRESASDLLVQNCDEYYSYSALTGLTRAGDESPVISEDPWELVEMALRQMVENNDVMRSDRLKQVILEMDPAFDEKALGFQKFNKFLAEAANRGIISLRKQENGQFEVGPPSSDPSVQAEAREFAETRDREGRGRRGRRGRGRRDERGEREPREPRPEPELELEEGTVAETGEAEPAVAETGPTAEAQPAAEAAPRAEAKVAETEPVVAAAASETPAAAPASTDGAASGDLRRSYDLLRRAVSELTRKSGPVVRDSDVKRRMLEMEPGWDEAGVGFSKFSRFLRAAHDTQVITLRKGENGSNEVLLGDGGIHVEEGRDERRGGRRDRGRGERPARGERTDREEREAPAAAAASAATSADATPARAAAKSAGDPKPATEPAAASSPQAATAAAAPSPVGFRRGSRGRPLTGGPPPLLEGQAVGRPAAAVAASQSGSGAGAATAAEPPAPKQTAATPVMKDAGKPARGGARAAKDPTGPAKEPATRAAKDPAGPAREPAARAAKDPTEPAKEPVPRGAKEPAAQGAREAAAKGGREPARPAGKEPKQARPAAKAGFNPAEFGLPTDPGAVADYIATEYKGVGPKSVQALVDAVGPGRVFETLETQPDRVHDLLGTARGEKLLEQWADDIAFRRANKAPTSQSTKKAAEATARRGRPGAGGRGGGAKPGAGSKPAKKGAAKAAGRGGRRGGGPRGSGAAR
jgi:uncharacterized protein (TIGR00288 family)